MAQETLVKEQKQRSSPGIQTLIRFLANSYILYTKTQNFHWNVEDARFQSLHKLFEHQYEDLADALDEIAERIRALNHRAPGSLKQMLELATLKESEGVLSGQEMIRELMRDHEAMSQALSEAIAESDESGDFGTADLYTDRIRVHQKAVWMLKSHLKDHS